MHQTDEEKSRILQTVFTGTKNQNSHVHYERYWQTFKKSIIKDDWKLSHSRAKQERLLFTGMSTDILPVLAPFYNSSLTYFGFSSSIRLMKSVFSMHPSQVSSQLFNIFFSSLTLSFFKLTVLKSIVFSVEIIN